MRVSKEGKAISSIFSWIVTLEKTKDDRRANCWMGNKFTGDLLLVTFNCFAKIMHLQCNAKNAKQVNLRTSITSSILGRSVLTEGRIIVWMVGLVGYEMFSCVFLCSIFLGKGGRKKVIIQYGVLRILTLPLLLCTIEL